MSYNKPEAILFSSIRAIQGQRPTDKGCPFILDAAIHYISIAAYEADE
jgi:hypothetical protein